MDLRSARIADILNFWFASPDPGAVTELRPQWFTKDPAFDRTISDEFGVEIEMALAGGLGPWQTDAAGILALVLLLDQFPRNVFRGSARAFAGDERALALAKQAVAGGLDGPMGPRQRLFLYLPFEHSEKLADQDRAVALIAAIGEPEQTDYAHRHCAVIARFGRFPHRNAALGRQSTIEELQFLEQSGSSF